MDPRGPGGYGLAGCQKLVADAEWAAAREPGQSRGPRAYSGAALAAFVFQNMQSRVEVGDVHQALSVDEHIRRVRDARPVRSRVQPTFDVARWYVVAHFFGPKWVACVKDAHAGILICREHQLRTLETARPIFVQVVRTEMASQAAVILLGRRRERRHGHGLGLVADIYGPDVFNLVGAIVGDCLVQHHDVVLRPAVRVRHAIGEWHGRMRATAKWWVDIEMSQQFRFGRVAYVDQGQAPIPPRTIGDVLGNDGVVKCDAIAFAPRRLFATGRPLAGQPPAADL